MFKAGSVYAYQDMWTEFSKLMHKTQKSMFNPWSNPFELTFDTLSGLSELTGNALSRLAQQQQDTLSFYLDPLALNSIGTIQKSGPVKTTAHNKRIESGRVALVTGGIGGIGTEICKQLYAAGHKVIATYIAPEQERAIAWEVEHEAAGYDIDIILCDVTDFDSCKHMSKELEKRYGHIDILVNCAGITRDATLRKMEADKWHAVLDTNLDSVFNITRNFINGMVDRGYGRIINISSVNGQKGQFGQTNYATAKAGMIGFSKALALEVADSGVTVNSVCPGYVGTSMMDAIPEDILKGIIAKIPAGRLAKPAEIAAAVVYLAGEDAAYITGSEISINGGLFTGIS